MLAHRQDDNNRHATRHQVSNLHTMERLLPSKRKNLQSVPARAVHCVPSETGVAAGSRERPLVVQRRLELCSGQSLLCALMCRMREFLQKCKLQF